MASAETALFFVVQQVQVGCLNVKAFINDDSERIKLGFYKCPVSCKPGNGCMYLNPVQKNMLTHD